jgi:hypothetical protein
VEASEGLLRQLHERNGVVERGAEEARRVEAGYETLVRVLKKNPAGRSLFAQKQAVRGKGKGY